MNRLYYLTEEQFTQIHRLLPPEDSGRGRLPNRKNKRPFGALGPPPGRVRRSTPRERTVVEDPRLPRSPSWALRGVRSGAAGMAAAHGRIASTGSAPPGRGPAALRLGTPAIVDHRDAVHTAILGQVVRDDIVLGDPVVP